MKKVIISCLLLVCQLVFSQTPILNWAQRTGGSFSEFTSDMTLDFYQNPVVIGNFQETVDFDPGPGVTEFTATGVDGYVQKSYPSGEFAWALQLRGIDSSPLGSGPFVFPEDIETDAEGNMYIFGRFHGTADMDPGPEELVLDAGEGALFLMKLNLNGRLVWVKKFQILEVSSQTYAVGLTLDPDQNPIITGFTDVAIDMDPSDENVIVEAATSQFINFFAKYNEEGELEWANSMDTSDMLGPHVTNITTDSNGNIIFVGSLWDTVDFDPGPEVFNLTSAGSADIFICKYDNSGEFLWANRIGASELDSATHLITDTTDRIYVVGGFRGNADFDPGSDEVILNAMGETDGYILQLENDGSFSWVKQTKSSDFDTVKQIKISNTNKLITEGRFTGTVDVDPGSEVYELTSVASADYYFAQYTIDGDFEWALQMEIGIEGDNTLTKLPFVLDGSDRIYSAGHFRGTIDFDPGSETTNLTSEGLFDLYIQALTYDGLGFDPQSANRLWYLSPNPNNGISILRFDRVLSGTIAIRNTLGQLIMRKEFNGAKSIVLNFPSTSGLYLVEISESNGISQVLKAIKE